MRVISINQKILTVLEITFDWRANDPNNVIIVFTLHLIFLFISWIKKLSNFDKVKMSDSEEEYEGDEIPSGNESVDGNDISDDEDCDLNVGIGRHSANYSRRFEDTQNFSDETWSNQSLPYNELPVTQNVGPKNIPDTVKTPGNIFLMLLSTGNIELMVQQTNLYYQQNKSKNDVLVTAEEMKKFIGVDLMMGIKRLPSYRDYWS